MGSVAPQTRIAVALFFGFAVIAGAVFIRAQNHSRVIQGAVTIATSSVRTYIPIKDSDNDGVPDWQEALQNSDPIELPASSTASSSYQAPLTVTGRFAEQFFQDYMYARMYGNLNPTTQQQLVERETNALALQARDQLFSQKDINIFDASSTQVFHDYGNHVANIILAHPNGGENELTIFQRAMQTGDMATLDMLAPIQAAYASMVQDLLASPVPPSYAKEHLDLLNAINAVREDIRAMRTVESDPLYTLIRMKRYKDDVSGLSNALTNLFTSLYARDHVRWNAGEPVLQLITFPQQ